MGKRFTSYKKQVVNAITEAEKTALEAIGLFVEGEAKLRTPVDTGNLRSSLDHKVDESKKAVHIGTNVEYAAFVEKGTRYQKEQPYLTPAVEENIDKIKKITEEYLVKI
jgi:HK97 gp10 family phage protein